jgi:hypothetical protein
MSTVLQCIYGLLLTPGLRLLPPQPPSFTGCSADTTDPLDSTLALEFFDNS